jgi:hypothetical protein
MTIFPTRFRLLVCVCILISSAFVPAKAQDSEPFYSLAAVAAIDHENKLWRLVDPTVTVEINVQRLLAAGISAAEVEAFKPRLIELDREIDPSLQIDWLDQKIVARIKELKSQYRIPMRRARINEAIYRMGGDEEPTMPYEIEARFREAIWLLLDVEQRDEFRLMNSSGSIALCRLTRDLPTTAAERLVLCGLHRDYYRNKLQADVADHAWEIPLRQKKALLDYWQKMRDLLGDERFAAYLVADDAGFGRMAFVLNLIGNVNSTKLLDLWWRRKGEELDDERKPGKVTWRQRKIEVYQFARATLGGRAMEIYLKDDDAKWLKEGAPWKSPKMGPVVKALENPQEAASSRREEISQAAAAVCMLKIPIRAGGKR